VTIDPSWPGWWLVYAVVACAALMLLVQSWLWLGVSIIVMIALSLGAIAAFFAMIASIIHFQILGAMGYLALTVVLAAAAVYLKGVVDQWG